MSSTNKTTNYELSQFVGTDKPAWLTDYNGDMSKIDAAIKNVSDAEQTSAGDITALGNRVTAAENDIVDIKAEDVTQDNRLTTLEGNYDTIHHEVVLLGDRVTTTEGVANAASTAATNASTAAANAQADATAAQQGVAAVQSDISQINTSIQTITGKITDIENELDSFGNATGYDFAFDSQTGELAITTHTPTP